MAIRNKRINELLESWGTRSGKKEEWMKEASQKGIKQLLDFLNSGRSLEEANRVFACR